MYINSTSSWANNHSSNFMKNVTIEGNKAMAGCGVFLASGKVLSIWGGEIKDNISTENSSYGGGIYAGSDSQLFLNHNLEDTDSLTISGNESAYGGGIATQNADKVHIWGAVTISDNTAKKEGGGLYIQGRNVKDDNYDELFISSCSGVWKPSHGRTAYNGVDLSKITQRPKIINNIVRGSDRAAGIYLQYPNTSSWVLRDVDIYDNVGASTSFDVYQIYSYGGTYTPWFSIVGMTDIRGDIYLGKCFIYGEAGNVYSSGWTANYCRVSDDADKYFGNRADAVNNAWVGNLELDEQRIDEITGGLKNYSADDNVLQNLYDNDLINCYGSGVSDGNGYVAMILGTMGGGGIYYANNNGSSGGYLRSSCYKSNGDNISYLTNVTQISNFYYFK